MAKKYFAELVKGQSYLIKGQKMLKGQKQEVPIEVYKALKANDAFIVSDSGEVNPIEAHKFNANERGETPDLNYEKDGTPKDPEASDMEEEDSDFTEEELDEDYDVEELKSLAETYDIKYAKNVTKETLIKKILEAQEG